VNFGELRFWLLLASGLAVISLLAGICSKVAPERRPLFDRIALAALGLFLLWAVNWLTWIIFVVVFLISYFGLKLAVRLERPKTGLIVILPVLFTPLLYYKYADFIARGLLGLDYNGFRDIVIPVGISFYTFQKAAAVIDTLAMKKPIPSFLDYLNFAAFFPQIVAGPIERREDLLPQVQQFRFRFSGKYLDEGFAWIVAGLFMKRCLADNFATHFNGASMDNPFLIWFANLVFGLRIYYDFAGYSLIALGVARCLGVELRLNFASPYCATSPVEFWRRWHITLSQWFRDYLYVPLGGNKVKWWAANVFIVFVVSGIWHGAGWNFFIWGLLHAVYLIAVRFWGKRGFPAPIGWALTMLAVFFAWLFFYETRSDALWLKAGTLLNPLAYNGANLAVALKEFKTSAFFVFACFLALALIAHSLEWMAVRNRYEPFYYHRRPATLVALVALICFLSPAETNDFIYFAF
jgi:alginate O-acetyltransferase complex protein AlgI